MDPMRDEYKKQWVWLIVLTAAHCVIDAFPGLMHTLLPAFQKSFGFSMSAGGALLTVFLVAANGVQIPLGHLRAERERPLFLYAGMLLVCAILLFSMVSPGSHALLGLSLISLVCGTGIGITHPELLRAVHGLDRISPAVSSAVFMGGGVAGFAVGGWVSTWLYHRIGMRSLLPFCGASILVLLITIRLKIRLAVERDEPGRQQAREDREKLSFGLILAVATLAACSAQTLVWIIPQRLGELGGHLTTGGLGVSMFSLAGGLGGIFMARHAHRNGELKLITRMLMCGIPFLIAYLFLLRLSWSVMLIFFGGFFCFGTYPLMVSAARYAGGFNLGGRMGLMVGGIWLAACLLPMLLGPAAHHFGTGPILFCVPIGYIISLGLALRQRASLRHG
jgi:MFS family permease